MDEGADTLFKLHFVSLNTMKNSILVIIVFLGSLPLHAQLDQDKVLHFGAGAIGGFLGTKIADRLSDGNPYWGIAGAFTASLLVGVAKEAYDEHKYKGWDNTDLAATVLGGVSVGVTITIFSEKKKKRKRQEMLNGFSNGIDVNNGP